LGTGIDCRASNSELHEDNTKEKKKRNTGTKEGKIKKRTESLKERITVNKRGVQFHVRLIRRQAGREIKEQKRKKSEDSRRKNENFKSKD
jgi:hypothetical protein